MRLLEAPKYVSLKVVDVENDNAQLKKRLAALGLVKGGELTLIDNALGAAICVVKDSRLALDKAVCRSIQVEVVA